MPPTLTHDDPRRPARPSTVRTLLAWIRVQALRHDIVRWSVAALAGVVLTISVTGARASASRARHQWGDAQSVWVATTPLDAGHLITSADVAQRDLPLGAIPDDSITNDPVGSRLSEAVTSGEVMRQGRLALDGVGMMAARLPAHTRGITIQVAAGSILSEGDAADLIATVGGRPVATHTKVISAADGWATFAVAEDMVSAVVNELSVGGVTPVLSP